MDTPRPRFLAPLAALHLHVLRPPSAVATRRFSRIARPFPLSFCANGFQLFGTDIVFLALNLLLQTVSCLAAQIANNHRFSPELVATVLRSSPNKRLYLQSTKFGRDCFSETARHCRNEYLWYITVSERYVTKNVPVCLQQRAGVPWKRPSARFCFLMASPTLRYRDRNEYITRCRSCGFPLLGSLGSQTCNVCGIDVRETGRAQLPARVS